VKFEKWQAVGNDYLIVEAGDLPFELTAERVRRICRAHYGCHSDGVLLLSRPDEPGHVARVRIFNPDGSEAELSGNGVRQAVLYLRAAGWTDEDTFSVLTAAGEIRPTITGPGTATVAMGRAALVSPDYPGGAEDGVGELEAAGRRWRFRHVSVGNPQCVIDAGAEVEDLDLTAIGPEIERHALFPNRTNVSFCRFDGSDVRARIFERGVGETLSSGTGACGAAVAAFLGGAGSPITVTLDGGELAVELDGALDLRLTGTAEPVFSGEFSPEFMRALERA
jgi:diaminopimelate epimerase